jgi:hypothetical protein
VAEENLGTAVLKIEVDDSLAKQTLDKLKQDITRISRTTGGRAGGQVQGGARESIRALEQAQERRFRLAQRIQRLEDRGGNVSRLRTQLGAQTEAQSKRQFESSRRISLELSRQVRLAEARLQRENQVAAALTRQTRLGGPSESIRGRVGLAGSPADVSFLARQGGARSPIGGAVNIPGSPAFLAAQSKAGEAQARAFSTEAARLARQGGARSSIGGATNIPGSPAAIRAEERLAVARERAAQAAEKAIQAENRRIGRQNVSPLRGGLAFPGSPGAIGAARQEGLRLGRLNAVPVQGGAGFPGSPAAIRAEERLTAARERAAQAAQKATEAEGRRIGRLNASPIRGGTAFPGSPAFLDSIFPSFPKEYFAKQAREVQAASRRQQDIISNALIGGAFPLLFGQGLGASLGGAAGGAAGGAIGGQFGFGLSLVGTALGTQVDIAVQKLGTLAKALDDPIANFDTLIQNASLSSKEVERYGKALIDSGRSAEAAAVIQSDLLATFGSLQGAKEYNDAVDTISRAFSQASTVLASFVAGPLAALIRTLSQPTGGLATGVSFEQLAGQLSPEQYRQVQARREQVTEASRASRGGVSAFLPPSNEDVNKGLQAGIKLAQQLLGIEKQRAELAARIASAQVQNQKSLSDSYKLIDASTQGYERQSLELQKQQVLNERNRKLLELTEKERNDPANPKAVKIQQDSALEVYRITQQINQLDKDRAAQKGLEAAQDNIKLQSIGKQIAATQALRSAQKGVARDTLESTQAIQAGVDAARDREREIGAQIDAARQRGGDAGEQEASRLVEQQKIAANETRLELEKGALALTEAGIQLRDNLRNAVVDFTKIRSDPQGLNKFLSPQQQDERARQDFQLLLPQFREAQDRFTQLTGAQAPVFTGPTAGVNDAIRDFIQRTQAEGQAGKDLAGTQQALATNLEAYNNTITQLAAVTKTLAEKNWAVNVAVSGAQSAISGDVLNGAVSP